MSGGDRAEAPIPGRPGASRRAPDRRLVQLASGRIVNARVQRDLGDGTVEVVHAGAAPQTARLLTLDEVRAVEAAPRDTCPRCGVEMRPGWALIPTVVPGDVDFPGDSTASTYSVGGPGRLIECVKCPECGDSLAAPAPEGARAEEENGS